MTIMDMLPLLLSGVIVTVKITFLAAALAFVLAFLIGFGRMSKIKLLRGSLGVYVEFFRGTSLLIQLFWIFFVLPLFGFQLDPLLAGVLGLGLNFGGYCSEVVRSAVLAVPKSQTEASIALNLSPFQRMRLVILPQAFRIMLPTFGNNLIELIKMTSLVSLITLPDLTFQGMVLRSATLQSETVFILMLVLYFLIAYPLTLCIRSLERKLSAGRI